MKIGVFICHCGENISSTVDCPRVARECENFSGVEYSTDTNICVRIRVRIL